MATLSITDDDPHDEASCGQMPGRNFVDRAFERRSGVEAKGDNGELTSVAYIANIYQDLKTQFIYV